MPAHAVDDLVRNFHARHFFFHVPGHACGLERRHPGQDVHLLVEPAVPDQLHEPLELIQVVDALGLDEIHPRRRLLGQTDDPKFEGIGKGIGGRPDEHLRSPFDFIPAQDLVLIPHLLDRLDQLDGIQIKYVFGGRVVPEFLVVSGETEDVADP